MNLRNIRQLNGISTAELATKMEVTPETINRWENGRRQPDIRALLALSRIFDCTVDDILNPIPTPLNETPAGE